MDSRLDTGSIEEQDQLEHPHREHHSVIGLLHQTGESGTPLVGLFPGHAQEPFTFELVGGQHSHHQAE